MTDLATVLATLLTGQKVGSDEFGNRYYRQRFARKKPRLGHGVGRGSGERRWVLYRGLVEASKVPAEWHGWLHYSGDAPIGTAEPRRRFWQKSYLPNLTGTRYAWRPARHRLAQTGQLNGQNTGQHSGQHTGQHTGQPAPRGSYEPWTGQ